MKIPLVNLALSTREQDETIRAITKLIKTGNFILGDDVNKFENTFAEYIGTKYSIGVASGTDALLLSLKALGIGKGDEIIIPAMTFIATATSIIHAGATPVLVDIFSDLPLLDYTKIEQKITKKTKAIIPVHFHGYPCEINIFSKLAKKHNLFLIEDACQSHGTLYKNKRTGSLGNIAAFSFYPSKNLGGYGDAGAITTSDKSLADAIRLLRNHGAKEKYSHEVIGYNGRIDTLQATVLQVKLHYLDKQNAARRKHAALYRLLLKDLPITLFLEKEYMLSNYHVFSIQTEKRDALFSYLNSKNIYCGIHYPIPLHLQPALAVLDYKRGDFPVAEKFAEQTLSLPMYAELTEKQIGYICRQIQNFYRVK